MRFVLAAATLLLLGGAATAQTPTVTESGGLRIQWTVEPQTRDFTAVCGQIFNDRPVSARNVSLRVEAVDGDRVVSRNIANISREIFGQSGWQFCVTVVHAPAYRVVVTSVDWQTTFGPQGP
jgi:hypothetical protein